MARAELYRRTGIQTMPINTVFQLSTEVTAALRDYEPGDAEAAEETYQRYLSLRSGSRPLPTVA